MICHCLGSNGATIILVTGTAVILVVILFFARR
jgi:hypothetical protein